MTDDTVDLGVAVLAHLEHESLSVSEAMDRIEAVTRNPHLQREILREAERRGVVARDGETVRPQRDSYVRFQSQVIAREGDFECRRCGAGLSTGHFVELEAGEYGPFGSTCIRKVLGRE